VRLDAQGPDAGGELRFTDPRTAALMLTHPLNPFHATNNVRLRPQSGMVVVFPSFLYHAVDVYRGGVVIARPPNNTTTKSGTYHDNLNRKGGATYQYKVCQANSTTVCSAVVTVVF